MHVCLTEEDKERRGAALQALCVWVCFCFWLCAWQTNAGELQTGPDFPAQPKFSSNFSIYRHFTLAPPLPSSVAAAAYNNIHSEVEERVELLLTSMSCEHLTHLISLPQIKRRRTNIICTHSASRSRCVRKQHVCIVCVCSDSLHTHK